MNKSIVYRAPILPVDTPTINGHIYSREAMEQAIVKYRESNSSLPGIVGVPIDFLHDPMVGSQNVAFTVTDLIIEGNDVIGTISTTDNTAGQFLNALLIDEVPVTYGLAGAGEVDEKTGIVTDYQMLYVSMVPLPADRVEE